MAAPWDGRLATYLGYGDAAERPATPNIAPGLMAWWRSTDTNELSLWVDGAWEEDVTGGGIPDAPSDGTLYGRKDAAWEAVPDYDLDTYGTDHGDMLFRGSTVWEVLPTEGSSALGYIMWSTGGATAPAWGTFSAVLDAWAGTDDSDAGDLLFRGPTIWESFSPGPAGYVLTSGGSGSPPTWEEPEAGIPDAPSDGEIYGRKDAAWEIIPDATAPPFTLGWGFSESPTADDTVIFQYSFVEDVEFAVNLAGSVIHIGANPTNLYNILIYQNGSLVATGTLLTDGTYFFNTSGVPLNFVAGDVLRVDNNNPDATLANVSITFLGARV